MTREELEAIRARAEAATPGPWAYDTEGDCDDMGYNCWEAPYKLYSESERVPHWGARLTFKEEERTMGKRIADLLEEGCSFEDADFIAHARSDIPALLAYIEQLEQIAAAADMMFNQWDGGRYVSDDLMAMLLAIKVGVLDWQIRREREEG